MLLHACIFTPYDRLHDLVKLWAEKCSAMLVVEHPADGKTKRVHCHFLIDSTLADDNPFREAGKKVLGEFFKRGNYWIASRVQKGEHAGKLLERPFLIPYMLKGKHSVSFAKNISNEEVDSSRQAWVDSVKNDTPEDDSRFSDIVISKVVEVVETKLNAKLYHGDEDGIELYRSDTVLDLCRTEAFKTLWGKRRIVPHASHYKIIASSAFMRIMEKQNKVDEAIATLKDLWY